MDRLPSSVICNRTAEQKALSTLLYHKFSRCSMLSKTIFYLCLSTNRSLKLIYSRVKVLEEGLEPSRSFEHSILSAMCLPIPPLEL